MNMARVYYLYTDPAKTIQSFLKHFEFEVIVTDGPSVRKNIVC